MRTEQIPSLNVFANGQLTENKEELVPLINRVINETWTPQAEIAQTY